MNSVSIGLVPRQFKQEWYSVKLQRRLLSLNEIDVHLVYGALVPPPFFTVSAMKVAVQRRHVISENL